MRNAKTGSWEGAMSDIIIGWPQWKAISLYHGVNGITRLACDRPKKARLFLTLGSTPTRTRDENENSEGTRRGASANRRCAMPHGRTDNALPQLDRHGCAGDR